METIVASEVNVDPAVVVGPQKRNRIQVSTNKKPLYFYVNLAKRYMQNHNEIELSALGMAIGTVVTVAEILKNNGLATEKKILTSTVGTKNEAKGRLVRKAKIEILLSKTENFDDLMAAAKAERSSNNNASKDKASGIAGEDGREGDHSVKQSEEDRN
ncbi:hypothetical protein HPP92_007976 [Vanilla planifolia]|uniref:DNA/RNA-binding protein Alba-like domain-containing protein n=1 Tax=Vanilla planifolia TaxID=51239 RepID=A0A835RJ57_VANPL|nr:hypothetical protein HPP92_007976 [Vanilla planifolia]